MSDEKDKKSHEWNFCMEKSDEETEVVLKTPEDAKDSDSKETKDKVWSFWIFTRFGKVFILQTFQSF